MRQRKPKGNQSSLQESSRNFTGVHLTWQISKTQRKPRELEETKKTKRQPGAPQTLGRPEETNKVRKKLTRYGEG